MESVKKRGTLLKGHPVFLRVKTIDCPGKGDNLPDVMKTAYPGDGSLQTDAKAAVDECSVPSKVKVPLVGGRIHPVGFHTGKQLVEVILSLGSPDDFAISFRCQQVSAKHRLRVVWIFLHVEGFGSFGVAFDEHGAVVLLSEDGLVLRAQVIAEGNGASQFVEFGYGVAI